MSAVPAAPVRAGGPPPGGPPRLADLVAAEWIKIRSLRSSFVIMVVTVLLVVGIGVLVCVVVAANPQSNQGLDDPTGVSLVGVALAQLAVAVFGVLAVTSEYSSGTIRVSLMAAPRRIRLLAAKAVVTTVLAVAVGEVVAWVSFAAGQAVLSGHVNSSSVSQPGVVRAVIGAGLLLGLLALLGSALGWLVRNAAAAIAIIVGIQFVLPAVLLAIPGRIGDDLQHFWPTSAGHQILQASSAGVASGEPGPWAGFAILAAFVAVLLAVALVLFNRRDA